VQNLYNNFLTGHLPSCLGKLKELESLDFSQNKLVGVIHLQLTQLTFLGSLNISHSHLMGPIPQGNQFGTLSNSCSVIILNYVEAICQRNVEIIRNHLFHL
jgi:Leucine-rich repeat (LRR) protein